MKRTFTAFLGVLATLGSMALGQTNYGKTVMVDANTFRFLEQKIIPSNSIALLKGDLSGNTNATTVIRLQGKSIPTPGAGDGGKTYVYNSGLGAFELVTSGGGTSSWGLISGTLSSQTDLWTELTNRYTKAEVDGKGYLTNEALFLASAAYGITAGDTNNWRTAYGWGNHALAGYLTNNATGVNFGSLTVGGNSVLTNEALWIAASNNVPYLNRDNTYGVGTIQSFALATITNNASASTDIVNWQTMTNWVTGRGYLTNEALFLASAAYGITSADTNNWRIAYGWGNHATNGYLTNEALWIAASNNVAYLNALNNFTIRPQVNGTNVLLAGEVTGATWGSISGTLSNQTDLWAELTNRYTKAEVDGRGYLTNEALFIASAAYGITSGDTNNWRTAYGWGNHANAGYLTNNATGVNFGSLTVGGNSVLTNEALWIAASNNVAYLNRDNTYGAGTIQSFALATVTNDAGASTDIVNWRTMTNWVVGRGYLTNEALFLASAAYGITVADTNNWRTAYGWGNHAIAGYLTNNATGVNFGSLTVGGNSVLTNEALFLASAAYGITAGDTNNWTTAYGWGNHANAGYLTNNATGVNFGSLTVGGNSVLTNESLFLASAAYGITAGDTNNWTTAYGWGNHASAGYLTNNATGVNFGSLTVGGNPVLTNEALWIAASNNVPYLNRDNTYGAGTIQSFALAIVTNNASASTDVVNWQTMTNWVTGRGYLTNEALFLASAAYGITVADTNNWTTAYGWGNHAIAGYLTNNATGINFGSLTVGGNSVLTNEALWIAASNNVPYLNRDNTYGAGTIQAFALATITNNASASTDVVNWRTMTNWVVSQNYASTTNVTMSGGVFTMVANQTNQVVSYGTNFAVAVYPTVTLGSNATDLAAVEIVERTTSNFTFRVRNASGFVTSAWQVVWNADVELGNGGAAGTAATNYVIGFAIDGVDAAVSSTNKGFKRIERAGTIVKWVLRAEGSRNAVVQISKSSADDFGTFTSIVASAPPTLSSQKCVTNTTLTGWTKTVAEGDYLKYVVTSCTATNLALEITVSVP